MSRHFGGLSIVAAGAAALLGALAIAQPQEDKLRAKLLEMVSDRNPQVRIDKVDHDILRVRRLDLVDKQGVIRMTIAAELPDPIIDGVAYKRVAPVSGIMVRDDRGYERGGFGYMAGADAVMMMIDHPASEAAGFTARKDGSTAFLLNAPAPERREASLGDRLLPGQSRTQIQMSVKPDGSPEVYLADKQQRPRLRLTVTEEGYGALEFLDSQGKVIETLAPERSRKPR